jgi:hypothetical protein
MGGRTIHRCMDAKAKVGPDQDRGDGRTRSGRNAVTPCQFRRLDRLFGLAVYVAIRALVEILRPAFDLYCWATVQRSPAEGCCPRPGTGQPLG